MIGRFAFLALAASLLLEHAPLAGATGAPCRECLAVFAGYGDGGHGADIYLLHRDGTLLRLTHDNLPKGLPVISPDGSLIAFSFPDSHKRATGTVVVLNTEGEVLAKALAEPARPGRRPVGMREVDKLAWIGQSGRKIAVTGTGNPTQTSTYEIDLPADLAVTAKAGPRTIMASNTDETDDAGSLTFSPDGLHIASVGGIPHFSLYQSDDIVPILYVDDEAIRVRTRPYAFASPLEWSGDSQKLAFLTRDGGELHTLTMHVLGVSGSRTGKALSHMLSSDVSKLAGSVTTGTWRLRWRGSDVYISPPPSDQLPGPESWKFASGDPHAVSHAGSDMAVDSFYESKGQASDLFGRLIAAQSALAPDDVDIWCGDPQCGALAARPRQNPDRPGTMFDQTKG